MRLYSCLLRAAKTNVASTLQKLEKYATYHPTTLTLEDFVQFGTKNACEKTSFLFLRKEIPVRLANIMKEINLLPEQLLNMPSVQVVESWYELSFEEILHFEKIEPDDVSLRSKFTETLQKIRNRHSKVVETMAQGVNEMKEGKHSTPTLDSQVQYFLDRFYMSRTGIRMLINQHVMLFGPHIEGHPQHIGCIDPYCDVLDVAEDAYESAKFLCDQYYLSAPENEFIILNPHEKAPRITMTYVPSHLYHMLFELFKNAMRAVVEFNHDKAEVPKLKTLICKGKHDLTIKVSDQGGGINMAELERVFNYMYSTAPRPPSPQAASLTPLAGYGYGLPLSRLYARYFQGDLKLSSVEGYGTDAYVYLKVHPNASTELLPIYNSTSSNRYAQSVQVADWSDPKYGSNKWNVSINNSVNTSPPKRDYCTYTASRHEHKIAFNGYVKLFAKLYI